MPKRNNIFWLFLFSCPRFFSLLLSASPIYPTRLIPIQISVSIEVKTLHTRAFHFKSLINEVHKLFQFFNFVPLLFSFVRIKYSCRADWILFILVCPYYRLPNKWKGSLEISGNVTFKFQIIRILSKYSVITWFLEDFRKFTSRRGNFSSNANQCN